MEGQAQVRKHIETRFRRIIDWDVNHQVREANSDASERLLEESQNRIQSCFRFDWSGIRISPGGTFGHHRSYIAAKIDFMVAYSQNAPDTAKYEERCLCTLQSLWMEWAGYEVTTKEELVVALEQREA